ncbi:hypothetical protein L1987_11225 [Smallanthus sonchifolius]|uniref:Uncharacterized protein n=1 Tax=Smallanthus sonchifolius TaxID=185202 RepID=A0ACB9JCF0_9ASTR|nr:hypothetical protein L1987_11225 [Smallanthus sonchifolius]
MAAPFVSMPLVPSVAISDEGDCHELSLQNRAILEPSSSHGAKSTFTDPSDVALRHLSPKKAKRIEVNKSEMAYLLDPITVWLVIGLELRLMRFRPIDF